MKNSLVWAKLKIRLAYFFQRCYNYPWRKDRWTLSDSLGHCGSIFTKLWSFWLKSTTITNCQTFIWCYLLEEIVNFQTTYSEIRLQFRSKIPGQFFLAFRIRRGILRFLETFQNRWYRGFLTSTNWNCRWPMYNFSTIFGWNFWRIHIRIPLSSANFRSEN